MPSATIQVVPKWTYQDGGKLAVITGCSQRRDLHIVTSKLLRRSVNLHGRNLLIRVTGKTKPGKYTIAVWCVTKSGQVDALDVKWVKVVKRMHGCVHMQCRLAYFDHAAVLIFALVRMGLASLMVAGASWRVPCWPGFLTG
jgi:hypothetical protein